MRTSFNIPDTIVEEFDRVWQEQELDSRSRAVREAMLEYIESHSRLKNMTGEVVALVGFDYQHHEVIRELHEIQFENYMISTSNVHEKKCTTG